jgi:hypothetical protein
MLGEWSRRAGAKKDFEREHSGVFATPGLPLAHYQLRNPGSKKEGKHVCRNDIACTLANFAGATIDRALCYPEQAHGNSRAACGNPDLDRPVVALFKQRIIFSTGISLAETQIHQGQVSWLFSDFRTDVFLK